MAPQIETAGKIEHAEENRLAPGDLLVADANVHVAGVVLEHQRREVDLIVASGPFQRIALAAAGDDVVEIVRRARVQPLIEVFAALDAVVEALGTAGIPLVVEG